MILGPSRLYPFVLVTLPIAGTKGINFGSQFEGTLDDGESWRRELAAATVGQEASERRADHRGCSAPSPPYSAHRLSPPTVSVGLPSSIK